MKMYAILKENTACMRVSLPKQDTGIQPEFEFTMEMDQFSYLIFGRD